MTDLTARQQACLVALAPGWWIKCWNAVHDVSISQVHLRAHFDCFTCGRTTSALPASTAAPDRHLGAVGGE